MIPLPLFRFSARLVLIVFSAALLWLGAMAFAQEATEPAGQPGSEQTGGETEPAADEAAASEPEAEAAAPVADVDTQQVQDLIATLEDENARAELVERLRLMVAAEPADEPDTRTRFLGGLSAAVDAVGERISALGTAFANLPEVLFWLERQVASSDARALWLDVLTSLVIVGIISAVVWFAVRWGISRPRDRMAATDSSGGWARLPAWAAHTVLDLAPTAAATLAAYAVVGALDPAYLQRLVVDAVINAAVILGLARVVVRAVVKPAAPRLRPAGLTDGGAAAIQRWVTRITAVVVVGYVIVTTGLLLGLAQPARVALLALLSLAVVIMVIVIIGRLRRPVRVAIGRAVPAGSPLRRPLHLIADHWHTAAIAYVVVVYSVWLLAVPGGFVFLLRATVETVVILLVAIALLAALRPRGTRHRPIPLGWATRYPKMAVIFGRYRGLLRQFARALVVVVGAMAVLEAWGLGGFAWTQGEFGQAIGGSAVAIVVIVLIALVAWEAVNRLIQRLLTSREEVETTLAHSQRMRTLLPLLRNAASIVIVAVAALTILSELGINIAPLLAGAGVIGLAIGFGAQTLVHDVITGLFILFEDTISVGDVVVVGSHGGLVEGLTIRTLRLRDLSGNVHTIPFSQVSTVMNMTRDFSYYVFDIGVAYRENVDEVIEAIRQLGDELQADEPFSSEILEPIEILGVDAFADSAVVEKARFKTRPIKQWMVGREFNRRLKNRFDELGIEIPFPHMTLYFGADKAGKSPSANVSMAAPELIEALVRSREVDETPPPTARKRRRRAAEKPSEAEEFKTPDVAGDEPAESSTGDT